MIDAISGIWIFLLIERFLNNWIPFMQHLVIISQLRLRTVYYYYSLS